MAGGRAQLGLWTSFVHAGRSHHRVLTGRLARYSCIWKKAAPAALREEAVGRGGRGVRSGTNGTALAISRESLDASLATERALRC